MSLERDGGNGVGLDGSDGDWVRQYSSRPQEVLAFCQRHALLPDLANAVRIVQHSFPSMNRLDVSIQADYEADGEWLIMNVGVGGDLDTVLANYHRCIGEWATALPWPAIGLIRLTYDVS